MSRPVTTPLVLERRRTPEGELCLRRDGAHLEIISNGVFLMSTENGASERALVDEALRLAPHARTVLIGGLGVGYTLAHACAHPRFERITVVELEPTIVEWHERFFGELLGRPTRDPRVEVVEADLADHLRTAPSPFDIICLDVDNAPDWTVRSDNDRLYTADGITEVADRLTPGGVAAVWSAHAHEGLRCGLAARFDAVETVEVPAAHGTPDVLHLGRGPRRGAGVAGGRATRTAGR